VARRPAIPASHVPHHAGRRISRIPKYFEDDLGWCGESVGRFGGLFAVSAVDRVTMETVMSMYVFENFLKVEGSRHG